MSGIREYLAKEVIPKTMGSLKDEGFLFALEVLRADTTPDDRGGRIKRKDKGVVDETLPCSYFAKTLRSTIDVPGEEPTSTTAYLVRFPMYHKGNPVSVRSSDRLRISSQFEEDFGERLFRIKGLGTVGAVYEALVEEEGRP